MSNIKKMIRDILPEWVKKPLRPIIRRSYIILKTVENPTIYIQPMRHKRALKKVRKKVYKKEKIKVAFFAIHSSVWKYDGVYQLMDKDTRFDPIVVVCPVVNYGKENMLVEMEKACTLFKSKGYNVVKTYNEEGATYLDVKKEIAPDIIFYTNPHRGLIKDEYYITNFKDTLTCYVPYGILVSNLMQSQYNQLFHNVLWKAFYETTVHEKMAKHYSRNRAKNVIITGFPGTDNFVYGSRFGENVWKNPDVSLKRIIWAPHHTIDRGGDLSYSCFLRYYQVILDIAENCKDKIQIAFKPHPLLKLKLNIHEEWGQQRADDYYQKWENSKNGQLETDDYLDLFNTSDAMIFDSASFVAEYLCCGKPSLFTFSDSNVKDRFNKFGKLALEHHYHAYDETQITDFIENVVCAGKDIKKENREAFYHKHLIPPNDKTASENIYNEIINVIWN